ncbi:MAG: hypothetical protein RML56_04870 [Burkholderiales bacterium]|nr:hypothetical protein [Burkholderiales bacterium]
MQKNRERAGTLALGAVDHDRNFASFAPAVHIRHRHRDSLDLLAKIERRRQLLAPGRLRSRRSRPEE